MLLSFFPLKYSIHRSTLIVKRSEVVKNSQCELQQFFFFLHYIMKIVVSFLINHDALQRWYICFLHFELFVGFWNNIRQSRLLKWFVIRSSLSLLCIITQLVRPNWQTKVSSSFGDQRQKLTSKYLNRSI